MGMWSDPATSYAALTPSDTTDEGTQFRGLYIGVSGDVVVVGPNDSAVTFANVPVGVLPVVGKRVNATGTTASSIVALY